MAGIFPEQSDGGLMPNPGDTFNPAQSFLPVNPPWGTPPLYYGNGCNVRLRPHVVNSLISEDLSVIDSVGMNYNPASLINLRTAIEYIEQKSLPEFAVVYAQGVPTNFYRGQLDPPLIGGYNNGQTLTVVPDQRNQGIVRLDVGGGWWVPVLRNDYQELELEDWPAGVPQTIAYWNGAFFMTGIAKSQVPIVLKGAIHFYIRPDGNDATGDGSANSPERAFRTINGAWNAIGYRYSAAPTSHIVFILGIPGDYEGCMVGPYGAALSIFGDANNPAAYRIHAGFFGGHTACVHATGVSNFYLAGVTCWMDDARSVPYGNRGICIQRCVAVINNVDIVLAVEHPFSSVMLITEWGGIFTDEAGWIGTPSSTCRFIGHGHSVEQVLSFVSSASMSDHAPGFFTPPIWYFENINIRMAGLVVAQFATVSNALRQWIQTGCTGYRYTVSATSNVWLNGNGLPPGDQDGFLGDFSTYNP